MGLIPDDGSERKTRALPALSLPGVTIGIAAVLAILGEAGRAWLRYDRTAIADGEWWRLLTAHFVHLGFSHFVLNAIALLLIFSLYYARFTVRQWLVVGLFSIAVIDIGFWWLQPSLSWYVGLSGVLHGLLAAGAVAASRAGRWDGWLMLLLLLAKILYEQLQGPLPGSVGATGGTVIVAAHLYGAVAGVGAAAAILLRNPRSASI